MQIEQELRIEGDDLELWGIATYDLQGDHFMDSDVGGSDGWEWTSCTLVGFVDENFILSRDQLVFAFGEDQVKKAEEITMEEMRYD